MIRYITTLLGIQNIPRWILIHLLIFSFALGGVQAFLFVSAVAGFVEHKMLSVFPEAMALSCLMSLLLFNLYKFFSKNYTYRLTFYFFSLIALFLLFLAIYLPSLYENLSSSFLLFVTFPSITIINERFVAGINDKISYNKYNQNLKRYTEANYLIGTSVFSAIIVICAYLYTNLSPFFPVLILFVIASAEAGYILKKVEVKPVAESEHTDSVIDMFSRIPQKSTVLLILFYLFLSSVNFICTNYIFLDLIGRSYQNITGYYKILGLFISGEMIICIVFKLFVYQNLIKAFKVNKALLLSPALMGFVMIILNFLLFFPLLTRWGIWWLNVFYLVVFVRFFVFVLKESFELYSIKMIFTAISTHANLKISENIHLSLITLGGFFSGVILLLIKSFDLISIRHIIYLNTFLALVWFASTILLFKKYNETLKNIRKKFSNFISPKANVTGKSFKERVMITTNLSGLKYLLNYQRYYYPFDYEKKVASLPQDMQEQLGVNNITGRLEPLPNNSSENTSLNFYDSDMNLSITEIEALASSKKVKDRIRAVKMIEKSDNKSYAPVLKMLINDSNDEVKRNSILAVANYYNTEILEELLNLIENEDFSALALDIFIKVGDNGLPVLISHFKSIGTNFSAQLKIIKIMGRIGSIKSINFLITILNYPNKWILNEVLSALKNTDLDEEIRKQDVFLTAIERTIGVLAWILSKDASIHSIKKNEPIRKSLDDEYNYSLNILFSLLHLKYQTGIIEYIRDENISTSDNAQIELHIELLSQIVDEPVKARLFALLHNNQKSQKIEQLKQYFPVQISSLKKAIKDLINADHEYVSAWTKACALKVYIENADNLYEDDIIAHLFNPDLLIAELAFFTIYKKDAKVIADVSERIPLQLKNRVTPILQKGSLFEHSLLFNKILSIQKISYFQDIMGHLLIPLADCLQPIYLHKEENLMLKCTEEEILPLFFSPAGELTFTDSHKRQIRLNQNHFYGLGLYGGGLKITAYSESVLYFAKPEQIGYIVIHFEELAELLFKYIQNSNFY
jgi:ATP:ADP antiporter, AAA family